MYVMFSSFLSKYKTINMLYKNKNNNNNLFRKHSASYSPKLELKKPIIVII